MCDSHPNLRVSGQSAPWVSTSIRQKTRALGAVRASFSSSRRTVEGKQLDAGGPSGGYVALALDRVAERQPLRRNVQAATDLQFSWAREIETGAKSSQCRDHFGRGIGLYRVIDLRRREKLLQRLVLRTNNRKIQHDSGGCRALIDEELVDPICRERNRRTTTLQDHGRLGEPHLRHLLVHVDQEAAA